MDRLKQKSKKDKPLKYVERDKSPLFITDVKTIKENLKIKEILRTVKMNSSMRIKAPRGSKVMQNKDFNESDDIFEGASNSEVESSGLETASATNPDVVVSGNIEPNQDVSENCDVKDKKLSEEQKNSGDRSEEETVNESNNNNDSFNTTVYESTSVPEGLSDFQLISNEEKQNIPLVPNITIDATPLTSHIKTRDRKLSLDQTMLSRREGLSQSELDLNSIGKSPLERKSSFFRKKMDSFVKNTTEMFKRQSNKSQSIQRRGSMSVSLQSLNENSTFNGDFNGEPLYKHQEEGKQGSFSSSRSSLMAARSTSSISMSQSERTPDMQSEANSLAGSRPALTTSQPLDDVASDSVNSFDEAYYQESLLNSRAISMSSGLDTAHGPNRRKNRMNRVTWLASEGLTNYLRRIIQDENNSEMQASHSYQDISTIPQNNNGSKMDSKGRRLSYQRAVSGEDPRYLDSTLRRKQQIKESPEGRSPLEIRLDSYERNGLPLLTGFHLAVIPDSAFAYLLWAEKMENVEDFYNWRQLPPNEGARQTVIREFVVTEANYIRHLIAVVEVFIATAHSLQDFGMLLDVQTERLFTNIPDVLNASLSFWEQAIYPMLRDACCNLNAFNTELMSPGFCRFRELFHPYEKYVNEQTNALDYLRSLSTHSDFMTYLTWCHSQKRCNRLQLSDIMAKPMQRLTKYSLILRRIIAHTDYEPERTSLRAMESFAKNYVLDLNRSIRQREELERLDELAASIEPFEIDFKDEDLDRCFRLFSALNLKAPMVNCTPNHSRTLIYSGDLRFKDNAKELDVRVFLLTDMILICKKTSSKGQNPMFKLIRPKYFIDKLVSFPRFSRNSKDITSIVFVNLDEVGSSYLAFTLMECKDSSSLKMWDSKFREAKLTYELAMWFARNPSCDISEMDVDSSSEYAVSLPTNSKPGQKQTSDEINIERDARERVATMMHRSMGASTEYDFSQGSMNTESFDAEFPSGAASGRGGHLRHPMKRNSTGGSSRNSRLSSFQQSTSAASHDEPVAGPSWYNPGQYRAGSSVEHVIPPLYPDDTATSITVNVVSESESETMIQNQQLYGQLQQQLQCQVQAAPVPVQMPLPIPQPQPHAHPNATSVPQNTSDLSSSTATMLFLSSIRRGNSKPQYMKPPMLVLQQSSPHKTPMSSRGPSCSRNTLRVQPQNVVMALVHSLPDLTIDPSPAPPRPQPSPSPQSASEKLYQSHQELLQRNRLQQQQQQQHFLSPDHRGTSYPPPSPTRRFMGAVLPRLGRLVVVAKVVLGLDVKVGRRRTDSLRAPKRASLKRGLAFSYSLKNPPLSKMGHVNSQSQVQAEAGPSTSHGSRSEKGGSPVPGPSTSSEAKSDKKSKHFSSRNKSGGSVSPKGSRKDDKGN